MIDGPAAKIVKQIFSLCAAGPGPTQTAKKLKADRVMTPTVETVNLTVYCRKLVCTTLLIRQAKMIF